MRGVPQSAPDLDIEDAKIGKSCTAICRNRRGVVVEYVEAEIIPRYDSFDRAHGTDHVRTVIRRSDKVDESTFARQPLNEYSRHSSAGRDYRALVAEYLEGAGV